MDRATFVVDVVNVAAWADLKIDRIPRARNERLNVVRVRQALVPREHRPDAVPRMVLEKHRAVVRGRKRASRIERETRDRGARVGTTVVRIRYLSVFIGVVG